MARTPSVLRIAIVVTMVAIGCIAWFALRTTAVREGAEPAETIRAIDAPKLDPAEPTVTSRESAAQVIPPTAVAEQPTVAALVLGGRVLVREDSSPVANAVVKLLVEQGWKWLDTKTDALGVFRFELDQPGSIRALRILATPSTTALDAWGNDAFPPGAPLERTFFVTRGATLSGTVVDRSGTPVVGAEVTGWCTQNYPKDSEPDRKTTSDAGGRFALTNLGESFFVAASARDQCCFRGLRGKLVPGTRAEGLEIIVAPCVTVRGHVVDDLDHRLAGATLRMDGANSSSVDDNTLVPGVTRCDWGGADVTCDANGAFEIVGMPGPGFRRNLWCEHETCIGDHALVDSSVADNRLFLRRGVEVTGIVLRSNGGPAAKAQVTLGHVGGRIRKVTTAEDGTFKARGVPAESKMILRVQLRGEAIYCANVRTTEGAQPLAIRLEPARALAGAVVDERGKGVPFANVRIEGDRLVEYDDTRFGEPTTWEFSHNVNRSIADASGRFRFDDLYDGTFEIRATDPAGIEGSGKIVSRSGVEDLVVRFDASLTATFVGRVVDDITGDSIREFLLTCMKPEKGSDDDWSGISKKFSTADGRFRYGGIESGKAELRVTVDGYAPLSFGVHEYTAGTHEFEARLLPVRTLSLEFARADGQRFEGGDVSASDQDGRALQLSTGPASSTSQVHVNAEPIQLSGLPARPITIHVHADGETFDYDFDLRVPIQTTQKIVLKAVPKVDLDVTLLDSRGKTIVLREPLPYVQDDVELILEDAQGQRVAKIQVKPTFEAFDITCQSGRNSSRTTRGEAVAHVNVRSTVTTAKLRFGGRAPVRLTVPSPDPDGNIHWLIDVSKY